MNSLVRKLGVQEYEFRIVPGKTRIEYDHEKDEKNRTHHGYALESAAHLLTAYVPFMSSRKIRFSGSFMENDEVRQMHLVEDDDRNVVMIVTTMRPDEVVRVISLRRASAEERVLFTSLTDGRSSSELG